MTLWGCSSIKVSESKMDANGTQLFQPWKWSCAVEWSTIMKQLVFSKKCRNKQFLSLVWVVMADKKVNNESLVSLNCHLLIVECYGLKAVEYGVKYNLILVSQTIFIDILAHLVFWGLCYRTISFSLMWLFLVALKTYILSSVLHVTFMNGAALHFKLFTTTSRFPTPPDIFMAPHYNLGKKGRKEAWKLCSMWRTPFLGCGCS